MDFYERKKRAIIDVDNWLGAGVSREKIVFKLAKLYGFSENFLDKRIDQIKALKELDDVPKREFESQS